MGLRIFRKETNFNFVGLRKVAFVLSFVVLAAGIASLVYKGGPKYGIDFAGGVVVQVKFDQDVTAEDIRNSLPKSELPDLVVQRYGNVGDNEYLLRMPSMGEAASDSEETESVIMQKKVEAGFAEGMPEITYTVERTEMVGANVSSDLRSKALKALFYTVLFIAIYISGRFEQRWMPAAIMAAGLAGAMYVLGMLSVPTGYLTLAAMLVTLGLCWYLKLNYALGAVVALIHDVIITVGVFSVLNKEFDLTVVAALLTIIGYSLNDTIIVFDRIRENIRGRISKSLSEIINKSINQTLSRTLLTSTTTLIVVVCLLVMGGSVIHDFAFALTVGVVVGTYSSIFVASPILLAFVPKEEVLTGGDTAKAAKIKDKATA